MDFDSSLELVRGEGDRELFFADVDFRLEFFFDATASRSVFSEVPYPSTEPVLIEVMVPMGGCGVVESLELSGGNTGGGVCGRLGVGMSIAVFLCLNSGDT